MMNLPAMPWGIASKEKNSRFLIFDLPPVDSSLVTKNSLSLQCGVMQKDYF
jgi:hypothetical protein